MTKDKRVYVERREKEGDYAVRKAGADRASATAPTQKEAIEIARKLVPGVNPHVERVRDTEVGGRQMAEAMKVAILPTVL